MNKKNIAYMFLLGLVISLIFTTCWLFSLACIGVPIDRPSSYLDTAFTSCLRELKNTTTYGIFYEGKKKDRVNTLQFATNGYEIITFSQDISLRNSFNSPIRSTVICRYDVRSKKTIVWANPYH